MKHLFGVDKSDSFRNLLGVLRDYNFLQLIETNPSNKLVKSELRKDDLRTHLGVVDSFKNILEDEEG